MMQQQAYTRAIFLWVFETTPILLHFVACRESECDSYSEEDLLWRAAAKPGDARARTLSIFLS
jgi:hypothetical protein